MPETSVAARLEALPHGLLVRPAGVLVVLLHAQVAVPCLPHIIQQLLNHFIVYI